MNLEVANCIEIKCRVLMNGVKSGLALELQRAPLLSSPHNSIKSFYGQRVDDNPELTIAGKVKVSFGNP